MGVRNVTCGSKARCACVTDFFPCVALDRTRAGTPGKLDGSGSGRRSGHISALRYSLCYPWFPDAYGDTCSLAAFPRLSL
jgi:hypothetical protein